MSSLNYLYAENFRGFSKAVIPIHGVNFLVGENSTGKTSILALLNLLSSPPFWFNLQFNSPDHEFGGFRDIMSTRTHEEFFTIGMIQRGKRNSDSSESWGGVLATFRESEGLPVMASIAHIKGDRIICLRPHGVSFKYLKIVLPDEFSKKTPEEVFSHFEGHTKKPLEAYSDLPQKIPSGLPPIHLLSIIESVIGNEDKSRFNSFMLPGFVRELVWLAPIRTRPRRTYDGYGKDFSPEGEHTPYELRKRLKSEEKAKTFRAALEKFGKSSGLFRKVTVHNLGKEASAPFELLVTLSGTPLRINSVGYGISQALPVVVEMLVQPKNSWFAIQQPEVHLHPKAQAALGDLLFRMAESEQKQFVIETHSDFMIDRFRLNMRSEAGHKVQAQILFFERSGEGNRVTSIPIQPTGEYPIEQPNSFRDFFLKEQLSILGL